MRNKLRCFWLYLMQRLKSARSMCFHCGKWGAEVCSLVYPKRLCENCATAVCRRADQRAAVKQSVVTFVKETKERK